MVEPAIVPTHNGFGWTSKIPNQITLALLDWLSLFPEASPLVLDIGPGLGVGTLPLLEANARVIALDIEKSHLSAIRREAESRAVSHRLSTIAERFPANLQFDQLDAIHCSNVLHFLPGTEIEIGATRMYEWLKPGGKVFLQVGTIFAGHIKRLLPFFEEKRRNGVKWAGETQRARDFVAAEVRDATPHFMNYLDAPVLLEAYQSVGFHIEREWYYTRTGLPEMFRRDGREHFGMIAVKMPD
jgi:2-polyprenyl-3-methyl-5-hydroxy-6-metoxy-1,4-benzoquinol methylase